MTSHKNSLVTSYRDALELSWIIFAFHVFPMEISDMDVIATVMI